MQEEFTKAEKKLARAIVKDEKTIELLSKVFKTPDQVVNLDKNNEELGEIVRANALAEKKIIDRWSRFIRAGSEEVTTGDSNKIPE